MLDLRRAHPGRPGSSSSPRSCRPTRNQDVISCLARTPPLLTAPRHRDGKPRGRRQQGDGNNKKKIRPAELLRRLQ